METPLTYSIKIQVHMTNLHQAFKSLKDPRIRRNRKHNLLDIIILSILSVLCGAESYDSIALFGRENFNFLKQFLGLKNGIPSHDTIILIQNLANSYDFCLGAKMKILGEISENHNLLLPLTQWVRKEQLLRKLLKKKVITSLR